MESVWPQYLAVISATVVSIGTGVSIAWPSPSIPRLISGEFPYEVSKEQGSYIATATALGYVCASPFSAYLVNRIGRKKSILLIALPQTLSFLMIFAARHSIVLLYCGRLMGGLGEGATFTIMAMYIGEISSPEVRGTLGSGISLTLRIGMLLVNLLGSYFTIETTSLICLLLPFTFVSTFAWMPESPYYLLMIDQPQAAAKSLRFLRQRSDVSDELEMLKADVARQLSESGTWSDLLRIDSNRRGFLILLGLRTFQQFSGISAFTLYTQELFKEAVSDVSPSVSANIFSAIQLLVTLLSTVLVDRLGRKPLLIFSCISCFLVLTIEAVYFILRDYTQVTVSVFWWLPLGGMILYIIVFSVGLGCLVNLMLGELLGQRIKAKALCLVNIYFAIVMSVTTKFFQFTTDLHGLSVPILVFGASCGLGALFCYKCVPETKGKTLEEIQQELKSCSKSTTQRKRSAV